MAPTTGLANVFAFTFCFFADRFAIGDLRFAYVGFNLVLTHHAINDDLKMQFAHTTDDSLPTVRISVNFERRVFLSETSERHTHFFLVGFGLRLNRHRNHRNCKRNRLERDGMFFIADGVAGADVFQSDGSANISG